MWQDVQINFALFRRRMKKEYSVQQALSNYSKK